MDSLRRSAPDPISPVDKASDGPYGHFRGRNHGSYTTSPSRDPARPAPSGSGLGGYDHSSPRSGVSTHDRDVHAGTGFVVQCYEDSLSWSDFLVKELTFSPPRIQVDLGGQAFEQWPPELFVSDELVVEALDYFPATGRQTPTLAWIRIDRFPHVSLARSGS